MEFVTVNVPLFAIAPPLPISPSELLKKAELSRVIVPPFMIAPPDTWAEPNPDELLPLKDRPEPVKVPLFFIAPP